MNKRVFIRSWRRRHATWERRSLAIIARHISEILKGIPTSGINRQNWEATVELNVRAEAVRDMLLEVWTVIGPQAMSWALDMLFKQIDAKAYAEDLETKRDPSLMANFPELLQQYFQDPKGGAQHIRTIEATLIKYVKEAIIKEVGGDYSQGSLARAIQKIAGEDYPLWMSRRIARTETTGAANWAALQGMSQTRFLVAKTWVSTLDERTRTSPPSKFDHVVLDGEVVAKDDYFTQNGVSVLFPGDPNALPDYKAAAGMVINCRCSVNFTPVRDANGRLVLASRGRATLPARRARVRPAAENPQARPDSPALRIKAAEDRILALGIPRVNLEGLEPDIAEAVAEALEFEARGGGLRLARVTTYSEANGANAFYRSYYGQLEGGEIHINITQNNNRTASKAIYDYETQVRRAQAYINEIDDLLERGGGYYGSADLKKIRAKTVRKLNRAKKRLAEGIEGQYWSLSSMVEGRDAVYRTVVHEMGHHWHLSLLNRPRLGFRKANSITEYGQTNFREYFTEWYTFYRMYPEKQQLIPRAVYDAIQKIEELINDGTYQDIRGQYRYKP